MKSKALLILASSSLLCSCQMLNPSSSSTEGSKGETTSTPSTTSTTTSGQQSGGQTISTPSQTSQAQTSLPETEHVVIFCETSWSHVWAWSNEGGQTKNFFKEWPGDTLQNYDADWKTYDFNDNFAPFYVILSQNGKNQSSQGGFEITSSGYWWFYQNQWYRENPLNQQQTTEDSDESQPEASLPSSTDQLDNRHRTWYQLLVYSFADGNNDGIGDFKGIVDHLDYLQNLGIGGLWLSPIHEASHYHGYDVKNYYSVNPTYEVGGVTFDKLLQECHKRDIRVLVDLVVNHTSKEHPWTWEHRDWYSGEQIFSDWMPDLNYDNQEVRTEIKKVGKYWLDKGVDGFRCDGAAWIYGGGGSWTIEQDKFNKTIGWWTEFHDAMEQIKSDVYIVGEVWTDLQYVEQFYSSGLSAFNFSAHAWSIESIKGDNNKNSSSWMQEYVNHQKNVRKKNANAVEASFLSNHDTGRLAMDGGMNTEQLKLSNAISAIAPGGSFVYYGDELGLKGSGDGWDDMKLRTPMPFEKGKTNTSNYMEGKNCQSTTASGKSADSDAKDTSSMYSSLASVINYKNENPVLYSGAVSHLGTGSNGLGAMKYEGSDVSYCLFVNASGNEAKATVTGDYVQDFVMNTSSKEASLVEGELSIPAYSMLIAKGTGDIIVVAK